MTRDGKAVITKIAGIMGKMYCNERIMPFNGEPVVWFIVKFVISARSQHPMAGVEYRYGIVKTHDFKKDLNRCRKALLERIKLELLELELKRKSYNHTLYGKITVTGVKPNISGEKQHVTHWVYFTNGKDNKKQGLEGFRKCTTGL